MTASQETRFRCDRCNEELIVPLANTPIATRGLVVPGDWATLWVDDATKAPFHLCVNCAMAFKTFMDVAETDPTT